MWAQALSRRESLDEGRYFQAMIWRDRASSHKLPMPRLWVGSERLAEFAKSKQSDGCEHPAQLDKRICMDIPPIIETRRAKRRTGAAYQHRRRRSLTGGHAVITHGVAWSTTALIGCSIRIRSQDSPPRHGPIVLRCPGNGREAPMIKKRESVTSLRRNRTHASRGQTVWSAPYRCAAVGTLGYVSTQYIYIDLK